MLKVNEIFGPTIQGEGKSQGMVVMFLRLAFCNLSCSWCDSKYTWDWKNFDKAKEVHEMDNDAILERLTGPNIVISGGEPFIQQRELLTLVGALRKQERWIEIETNGTIIPDLVLMALLDQVNCSPKLSNSGDSRNRRLKTVALTKLSLYHKVYFKFVIGCEKDIEEVLELVTKYQLQPNHVYLMPLGKTPEELLKTTQMVRELSKKHGFVFSSRLHIELWGMKRGI